MENLHEQLDQPPRKEDVAAWKTCHFLEDAKTRLKYPELTQSWLATTLKELSVSCPDEKDLFADKGENVGAPSNENLYHAICAAQETLGVTIDGIFGPKTYLALKLWSDRNRAVKRARIQEEQLRAETSSEADENQEVLSLDTVSCFGASLEVGMMSKLTRLMPGLPNNKAEVGAGSSKILSKINASPSQDIKGDTVIYSGGVGNDVAANVSTETTLSNMIQSVSVLLAKGAKHIVLPLRVPYVASESVKQKRLDALNARIRETFGNLSKVTVVEAPSALIGDKGELRSEYGAGDGVHLNSAGYSVYAGHMQKVLAPSASEEKMVA